MLRRNAHRRIHRRAGMTLVEILVVIGIIATLMGLLLAAVPKVLDIGPRADTTARIAAINNAIGTFKSNQSMGQVRYIPAGRPDGTNASFRLRNSYTSTTTPDNNSPEAAYIMQVFGSGTNLASLGNGVTSAELDANQTLTFFLAGIPEVSGTDAVFTGFAQGQQPFNKRSATTDTRKGPFIDLGGKKKYELDNGFARILDGFGTPFAYFCALDGKANRYFGYNTPRAAGTQAYGTGSGTSRQYENASGFQLISAGKDKAFGTSGDWSNVGDAGKDDQANFSTGLLGAGPK